MIFGILGMGVINIVKVVDIAICIFLILKEKKSYALVQFGVLLVYPVLKLYNGKKGSAKWMKWFFYLYYPLHLAVIGVLRICMYGNIGLLF